MHKIYRLFIIKPTHATRIGDCIARGLHTNKECNNNHYYYYYIIIVFIINYVIVFVA